MEPMPEGHFSPPAGRRCAIHPAKAEERTDRDGAPASASAKFHGNDESPDPLPIAIIRFAHRGFSVLPLTFAASAAARDRSITAAGALADAASALAWRDHQFRSAGLLVAGFSSSPGRHAAVAAPPARV